MKIWMHKADKRWYKYWKPKWLNCISWKDGEPKIYRWLWFGYCSQQSGYADVMTTNKQEQCSTGVITNRTYRCLGCKHYDVKVINDKGGTAKTCNVNKDDVRIIVDLDAPDCTDYVYGW